MAKIVLYHGEPYQRAQAVKKAIKVWKRELEDPEIYKFEGGRLDPENLEQLLGGSSLFSETKIIRVTQAEELVGNDTYPKIIEKHSFDTEALLLEADSLNKNSKLYKTVSRKGKDKKFSEPTGRNFPRYVSEILSDQEVKVTSNAKQWLVQILDQDLLRVKREAEKLKLYKDQGRLSREEVKEVVWARGKDKLFDFFDALFTKRHEEATKLLEDMLEEGVEEGKIFFMLAKEVRRLIKVQGLASSEKTNKEISSKTGLYEWLVKKKRDQASNFSKNELEELLKTLQREDLKVKQGETDLEDVLFRIVYQTYATDYQE